MSNNGTGRSTPIWVGRWDSADQFGTESAYRVSMENPVRTTRELPRRCPQCHTIYDEPARFFVDPVKCCLPCYARLPKNRDLWVVLDNMENNPEDARVAWRGLCMRAANSKYATKQRRSERLAGRAQTLGLASESKGLRFVADVLSSGASNIVQQSAMAPCQGCGNLFAHEDLQELPACPHDEIDGVPLVLAPQLCGGCRENAGSGLLKMKCYVCHEPHAPEQLYFSIKEKIFCSTDWIKYGRKQAIG